MVLVTELAITMIVKAAHHNTAACAAGCRCRKRISENHTVSGNGIDCRGFRDGIAVAAQGRALIIGNDKQHIAISSPQRRLENTQGKTGRKQAESQAVGHGVRQHDRSGVVDYKIRGGHKILSNHNPAEPHCWMVGHGRASRMASGQYSLMRMSM